MNAILVSEICSMDNNVLKVRLRGRIRERLEVYIKSGYFFGDAEGPLPSTEMKAFLQLGQKEKIPLQLLKHT